MSEKFKMSELEPLILESIGSGSEFVLKTHGTSMLPMLSDGKDSVVLIKAKPELEKYDVALYKREGGQFVLHRVVGKDKNGYIFRGDNQTVNEHGIKHEQIIAEMTAYIKAGERIDITSEKYKKYLKTLKLRYIYKRLRAVASRIKHKIVK